MGGLRRSRESLRLALPPSSPEIDSLIEAILDAEKEIIGNIGWKIAHRRDYSICNLKVVCPAAPRAILRLALGTQRTNLPQKSSFTLLFGGQRIFSLDVEPRRSHRNTLTLGSVKGTHWHRWPCSEAEADDRTFTHQQWFEEFRKRARITFTGRYRKPPYEPEQLELMP